MTSTDTADRREREAQARYWRDAIAGRRHPDHPVVRAVFGPRAEYIASLVDDPGSASALDVGSGNGFMTLPLHERMGYVANVDLAEAMLRRNPCRPKVLSTATTLPFADDAFDIVTASHLLHHLVEADRLHAIAEMLRVARRYVVIYEPNRNNPLMFLFGCLKRAEWMSLRFSRAYLERLLRSAGAPAVESGVTGLLVPNKAPAAFIPMARRLERTVLARCGFYIRAVVPVQHRRDGEAASA